MDKKVLVFWLFALIVIPCILLVTYVCIKPFVAVEVRQAIITLETLIFYFIASGILVSRYIQTDKHYDSR